MWLYSDRFFPDIFVFDISRDLRELPQSWRNCNSPLYVRYLQKFMSRFSKQGRVSLYSDRFSPVIFVSDINRDLSVLPQSWSICSSPLSVSCLQDLMFRFSKQGRVPLCSDRFSPVSICTIYNQGSKCTSTKLKYLQQSFICEVYTVIHVQVL